MINYFNSCISSFLITIQLYLGRKEKLILARPYSKQVSFGSAHSYAIVAIYDIYPLDYSWTIRNNAIRMFHRRIRWA